jgi:pimeloyl-ACP methyl ester carboxylesterase
VLFSLADAAPAASGVPVVLLPGLFAGAWIWEDAAAEMRAAGLNVSPVLESLASVDCLHSPQIEPVSDAIIESCDAAGIPMPAVWCGNSLGALIALDIAARHPGRTAAAVISGCPGLSPDPSFGLPQNFTSGFAHQLVERMFHDPSRIRTDRVEETYREIRRPRALLNVVRGFQASRGYDVAGALNALDVRTLFVWGREDVICPPETWVDAVAQLPDARMVVVEDAGHSPMIEQPGAFAQAMIEFVGSGGLNPMTRELRR